MHGRNYKKIGSVGWFFFWWRKSIECIKFITFVSILVFSTSFYTLKYKCCAVHSWSTSVFLFTYLTAFSPSVHGRLPFSLNCWHMGLTTECISEKRKKAKVQIVESVQPMQQTDNKFFFTLLWFFVLSFITWDDHVVQGAIWVCSSGTGRQTRDPELSTAQCQHVTCGNILPLYSRKNFSISRPR